ncbi:MAG TPA: TIGR00153 family protein [Myxococcota bacterium]|nr:TIGR00153 family protein [Myxococcota bacterium]
MQTLARLFGKSPFAPLQTHMAKVASCVHEVPALFEALLKKEYALIEPLAHKISKLEHDADLTKNDIRNHLPPGLLLPISRASLLEILSLQDNIADRAEDVAVLMTFLNLEISPLFQSELFSFLDKNLEAFEGVFRIVKEMGQLLESSFGGSEAEKVRKMVDEVAFREHESDLIQRTLMKKIFSQSNQMSTPAFFLWMRVIQEVAWISDESEKLANRICMLLEVK